MEFQKLPTKEFFNAVKLRVKDTSAQSLNRNIINNASI